MKFMGGEFSTGTTGNFQPELTCAQCLYLFTRRYETLRDVSRSVTSGIFLWVNQPKGWLHAILRQFLVANLLKRPSREQVR